MVIKIAKLRHRITIQDCIATSDNFGAETLNWLDVASVWANISPISGKEYFAAQQVQAEVTTKLLIRWLPGIKPAMRVLFGTRVFNILAVINTDERNRELVLMAKEVVE